MPQTSQSGRVRRIGRLALVTAVAAAVVSLFLFANARYGNLVSTVFLIKAELFALVAVEIVYGVAAVLSLLGAACFGLLWLRGRRRGERRPFVARALLLCGSLLLGAVLAEVTSTAWQKHRLSRVAIPVGGLPTTEDPNAQWRLPAALEDPTLPTRFPDPPEDPAIDIAVLGESSAEGVPFHKWFSIGKIVAWQLEKAIPARPVQLRVLARSGDTLQAQHHALANLVRRPELLIVYCGHNEIASRLFWSRDRHYYFDSDQPSWTESLHERIVEFSSVCELIREEWNECSIALPPSRTDKRELVDVPVYTRVEYEALLVDFRQRLEAIVTYGHDLGSLVVLIIPPGNDAGYDPNRSSLPAATPRAAREVFAREFLAARRLEPRDLAASLAAYRALVAKQPGFAEVHYRLAQLLEKSEEWEEAYQHYIAARDHDGHPQRMMTSFQSIYRDVAAHHDCILIDGQSYFHAIGRHGLLDDDLFHDAMHPSMKGQIALAQAVLHALADRRAFGWPSDYPAPIIEPVRCAAHFGFAASDWRKLCEWCTGFYTMVSPLRYETAQRTRKRQRYERACYLLAAGDAPESLGLPNIAIPHPVPLLGDAGPSGPSTNADPVPLSGIGEPQEKRLRSGVPGSGRGG
jgi:hypothetical protein